MKKIVNKFAWFLAILAGFLKPHSGDWMDKVAFSIGVVLGIYLISLLLAWLLSLIADKKRRQERQRACLSWLMIFLSAMSITSTIKSTKGLSSVKTDKSPEFSEQVGNLYRNTKYGFRIKFPEGWEIKPGDGPNVLQKAVRGGQSINIIVRELPELANEDWVISDLMSLEEFEKETESAVRSKYEGAIIIDSGETKIDNLPAYWIKYKASYSTLDVIVEMVMIQYQVLYQNIFYIISAGSHIDDFNFVEPELKRSISTFVFEDY